MNEAALIDLWEAAWPLAAPQRARLLAQAAGAPADAGPGARHAALLALHTACFGAAMPLRSSCPQCAAELAFEVDAQALAADAPATPAAPMELTLGDTWVRFRAPADSDLLGLHGPHHTPAAAARLLFERCVVAAHRGGQACAASALGPQVQAAVAEALDAADPLAALSFALQCPDCEHRYGAALDLAELTATTLRHRAEGLLADVAALAQAYGWCEADVLALTPWRRAAYLQLAGVAA